MYGLTDEDLRIRDTARDFVDGGWDVKKLFRSIVLSSTYRQTSDAAPALYAHVRDKQDLLRAVAAYNGGPGTLLKAAQHHGEDRRGEGAGAQGQIPGGALASVAGADWSRFTAQWVANS